MSFAPAIQKSIPPAADKEFWGPRVWLLLHRMADASNRRDVLLLWNSVLKATNAVIPCELCRKHMSDYWLQHPLLVKKWNLLTGEQVRQRIREALSKFHNSVNGRLGKPLVELGSPPTPQERGFTISEANRLYLELVQLWSSRISDAAAISEWRRATSLLLGLLAGGSQN